MSSEPYPFLPAAHDGIYYQGISISPVWDNFS